MASIQKRKTKGGVRWDLAVFLGADPDTGKHRFHFQTFETKKAAAAKARKIEGDRDQGLPVQPSKQTLADYLRTSWLEDVKKGSIRTRTYEGYDGVIRRYLEEPPAEVEPGIGGIGLHRLTPEAIQHFYRLLQDDRGLSARTVRSIHAVIRQGLQHAARTGAVPRNVADLVVLPRVERREVRAMTPEEARRFLDAARTDPLNALWLVLLNGGLRPSEAFALQWRDVDLGGDCIRIERALSRLRGGGWKFAPPKTAKSRRTIILPPETTAALREHQTRVKRARLAAGATWEDHDLVFPSETGTPLYGGNTYNRDFRRVMAQAEIGEWGPEPRKPARGPAPKRKFVPGYRMYDLRHTCATLLLRAGENPKVVSERLGHSSVAFTLDVYSASVPSMQQQAADKLAALLGS